MTNAAGASHSLTRAEAERRARLLRVRAYAVDLDVTGDTDYDTATVVDFACTEPGADTFVELKGARLVKAVLNGQPLDPARLDGNRLPLTGLRAENRLEVEAVAPYSHGGEGIHRFTDPEDGEVYLYGQAPLDDAQRIFACFDQPDLKAPITLRVTAPPQWTVRGNAAGARVAPGRWEFEAPPPLSTYLFSLLAGPWHVRAAEHDGIPLGLLCRRSLAPRLDADAEELFSATAAAFDRYHALFGVRYPFTKYDQSFVPEFSGGAVENPGLVNFREEFLFRAVATGSERRRRFVVMAHELAHMWFGDLVALRWWDDIWLNEAFAEYMGWRVAGETGRHPAALADFAIWRERWGHLADERPSTHPVAPDDVTDTALAMLNFDGISYAKGAAALRQLSALIGDDVFLTGLRAYFDRFRFANATLADLLAVLGETAGRDLTGWAELWLRSTGANTLRPVVTRAADGTLETLAVEQSGRPVRPHSTAVAAYASDGSVRRVPFTLDRDAVPLDGFAGSPTGTVLLLNDGAATYAKVRLDDGSRAALPAVLPDLDDALARAVIWTAVIDAVRDALMPPAEFLALLVAALPAEREEGVFDEVLAFARDGLARRGLIPFAPLAGVCATALADAAPASGRQLTMARALVSVADAGVLRSWLAGQDLPDGLTVDAGLRWALLLRLAVLGAAGEDDIAVEELRDPSAAGAERAAACRAALPTAAAKAKAWDVLVGDERPRIAMATAANFWQPGQEPLTDPYVERYFADVPAILGGRYALAGLQVVRFSFPQYDSRALPLADAMLARADLDPSLRREIGDGADELRRWTRLGEMLPGPSSKPRIAVRRVDEGR
ncbi:aminopeptidase N [Dactylosporangium roseum]|uniref:Aminopeptidase N n=1 Tax=Dactylosporangium roseum TaxID=47989 RepID=A0ABY5ZAX6_9ACTN|nr:aminopeptidase N [Dactylosporangium roseum]UWZ37962.1 aminopeptidase N [Dactylosporangium roseum]